MLLIFVHHRFQSEAV